MRFAAFRPKGKFYLLGFGVFWLGVVSASECAALSAKAPVQPASDSASIAKAKYETLKTRVSAGDLSIEWSEFRAVAADAGLTSYDWHPSRRRVLSDIESGNLTAALSGAQAVIAHNMADPEGHLLAMTVFQRMDMDAASDRERNIVDALVKSIMSTGDGLSERHAWSTVSASEEEFVVNMVLDADTESQSVVRSDGRAYDLRTVRAEDGAQRVLWFRNDAAAGYAAQSTVSALR